MILMSTVGLKFGHQEPLKEQVKNHKPCDCHDKLFKVILGSVKVLKFEALPQASGSFGNGK